MLKEGELRDYPKLVIAVVVLVLVSVGLFWLSDRLSPTGVSDYYITEYDARVDGLSLIERYVFVFNEPGYHMVFRNWTTSLVPRGYYAGGEAIELEDVVCPSGSVPYMVDNNGKILPLSNMTYYYMPDIESLIEDAGASNEVGCYFPRGVPVGRVEVLFIFKLHPQVSCNSSACGYTLTLVSSNIRTEYKDVRIVLFNYSKVILPDYLEQYAIVTTNNNITIITLSKPAGLQVTLGLITNSMVENTPVVETSNPLVLIKSDLSALDRKVTLLNIASNIVLLIPVFTALAMVVTYIRLGREYKPSRPIPEGFPPRTGEKPWQVALLYTGKPGKLGQEVIAATLADLHHRGILKIEEEPDGTLVITILNMHDEDLDEFERSLLGVIRNLSEDGKTLRLKPGLLNRLAPNSKKKREIRDAVLQMREIAEKTVNEAIENAWAGKIISTIIMVVGILSAGALAGIAANAPDPSIQAKTMLGIVSVIVSSLIAWMLPEDVLGRWKPGYLEKYIAWKRFREKIQLPGTIEKLDPSLGPYVIAVSLEAAERMSPYLKTASRVSRTLYWHTMSGFSGGRAGGGGGFGGGGAGAR